MIHAYQHTLGHVDCEACAKSRSLAMHATIAPAMSFLEASQLWIDSQTFEGNNRSHYVKPRTIKDFHQYRRSLLRMFGALTLAEIHVGHVREYQRLRSLGELGNPEFEDKGKREVGPHKINQEVDMLRRILKRAHAWTPEYEEGNWVHNKPSGERVTPLSLDPLETHQLNQLCARFSLETIGA